MEEEIRKILKMLEEGKINAEEAERLINALEERRSKIKNIDSLGKIIGESVSSALSIVPSILESVFTPSSKEIREKIEWNKDELLEISLSGGDLDIKTEENTNEINIEGKGKFHLEEGKIKLAGGDFSITLPSDLKKLRISVSAGDLDGSVSCEKIEIILNAGDVDLNISCDDLNGVVNMGDMDIKFLKSPKNATLNCNIGDLSINLPENYNGTIIPHISLGDLSISKEGYRFKDKKYVFGNEEESKIEIFCKMGDVSIN